MRAPAKGASKMPMGLAVISPTKTPIVAPHAPVLEPPAFFVKNEGTKKLISSAARHTSAVITSVLTLICVAEQKYETKSPPHARGVPGSPGTMQPINPTKRRREAATISTISMAVIL